MDKAEALDYAARLLHAAEGETNLPLMERLNALADSCGIGGGDPQSGVGLVIIDLRVIRQTRCASTPEGHRFDDDDDHGVCSRCGTEVLPQLRLVKH